jgi:flagellar basal-body rod modification protein FlgD
MSTGLVSALGQQTSTVSTAPASGYPASGSSDAWNQVNLDDFVKLLVTELQNQDPLEPMKNQEILQQISQIREIESNQRLTETLGSVLLGQSVATAANLLQQNIVGLSEDSQTVTGRVDRVSIEDGVAKLHIGDHTIALKDVAEILPAGESNG